MEPLGNEVVFGSLALVRTPEAALADAGRAAKALVAVVRKNKWEISISGRPHMKVEGWQTLGHFYGISAKIRDVQIIQYGDAMGFEATADALLIATGQIISSANAICMNDEERWSSRPKYEWKEDPETGDKKRVQVGEEKVPLFQLRSMAQTRAEAKVLRNVLAWVVAMAGYCPTPAEEMTGNEYGGREERPMPQRTSEVGGGSPVISEPQRKRLYAISKQNGWSTEQMKRLLQANGFETSTEVTREKYDEIVKVVSIPPLLQPPTAPGTLTDDQWRDIALLIADNKRTDAEVAIALEILGYETLDQVTQDKLQNLCDLLMRKG